MERIEEKTTIYTRQHWSRAREGGWWDLEIKKKKILKREKKKKLTITTRGSIPLDVFIIVFIFLIYFCTSSYKK